MAHTAQHRRRQELTARRARNTPATTLNRTPEQRTQRRAIQTENVIARRAGVTQADPLTPGQQAILRENAQRQNIPQFNVNQAFGVARAEATAPVAAARERAFGEVGVAQERRGGERERLIIGEAGLDRRQVVNVNRDITVAEGGFARDRDVQTLENFGAAQQATITGGFGVQRQAEVSQGLKRVAQIQTGSAETIAAARNGVDLAIAQLNTAGDIARNPEVVAAVLDNARAVLSNPRSTPTDNAWARRIVDRFSNPEAAISQPTPSSGDDFGNKTPQQLQDIIDAGG